MVKQDIESRLDGVFHALADRTRRDMLRRLAARPRTVAELAEPLPMSLAAASKHLGVLECARLVTKTREGRIRRCRLNAAALAEVHGHLEKYKAFWENASLAKIIA